MTSCNPQGLACNLDISEA